MAKQTSTKGPADIKVPEKIPPLASLAYRNFRLVWFGQPISSMGLQMRNTANAWQVYQLTGSPALVGLTFLFQGLPAMVMGLFGGTLADIIDRRRLLMITMTLEVGLALLLGTLTVTGAIEVWHIYAITFTSATFASMEQPARSSLIPRLVPRPLLLNATTLMSTAGQVSMMVGPLLGGAVIAGLGASVAYYSNAAMITPAIVAVVALRIPPDSGRRKVKLNVAAVFEGLRFAIGTRVLIAFLLLDMVTMVLGYYPAMMTVFADILKVGPLGLGALLSAPAFGAVIGFVAILLLGQVERKGFLIIAVSILHAVVLIGFAVSPWFLMSLALVAMLGFLDSMSVAVRQTSFQLLAPEEVRGRVVSLVYIFAVASNSMGGAYLGVITEAVGARVALGMGGAIAGAFAIGVLLFWKQVRDFKA